jgi:hypothetical protein
MTLPQGSDTLTCKREQYKGRQMCYPYGRYYYIVTRHPKMVVTAPRGRNGGDWRTPVG